MRRAVPVLVATVAGLALLAGFHTTTTKVATATPTTTSSVPPGAAPPPEEEGVAPTTSTTRPATTAARTVDGPPEENRYGTVQVRVTVRGGRLVDVQAVQLPSDRRRSADISDAAGPILREEALQAQSANIDILSGATYTSEGYQQSLQAALDLAGISAGR